MTSNPQQSVEERVARHLAAKDWLVEPGSAWARRGKKFHEDYLAAAREVIAIVREGAASPVGQPARAGAALRDRIAETLTTTLSRMDVMAWLGCRRGDRDHDVSITQTELGRTLADAVLAVFPEPPSRAAGQDEVDRLAEWLWDNCAEDERSGLLADDPRRIATVALHWPEPRPDRYEPAVEAQQQPDTETRRCTRCTHPKGDHDGRTDHRAKHSPRVAGEPWCHACNATCDYVDEEQSAPDLTERKEQYAVAIHDAMESDLSLVDQEPGYQALIARAAEAAMALADAETQQPTTEAEAAATLARECVDRPAVIRWCADRVRSTDGDYAVLAAAEYLDDLATEIDEAEEEPAPVAQQPAAAETDEERPASPPV